MNEMSKEAVMVLSELSESDIKQLHRDNPFRNDRNAKIRELYLRGVKICIISEISGISFTSIEKIIFDPPGYQKKAQNLQNT